TELGAFIGDGDALSARHQKPITFTALSAQEGVAEGAVYLHEPRVVVTNPIADDPDIEQGRLEEALDRLRVSVDQMLSDAQSGDSEQLEVLEAYKMFANSKGWRRRMEEDIQRGLSAEAAVEKEQSTARSRIGQSNDPYLRERLHDIDDLSNRLLRLLTGQGDDTGAEIPNNPILVAQNIGPAELLDYGRNLRGIVLEEGSVGSHAAIVARALAIPLVIHAKGILTEALNGDLILVDGDQGSAHLRPDEGVLKAVQDKIAMQRQEADRYIKLRKKPAQAKCGSVIKLLMNAGLMADLPSLTSSGAEGVGLFRTELQFLTQNQMPKRAELVTQYARVINAAKGHNVTFRTLDIGSDKVLSYMAPQDEPNPAMGWRAIRVGLDKPGILRMQLQALLRATAGQDLSVMFPFVAQYGEFQGAKAELHRAITRETKLGHELPSNIKVGAMLETPSLAYAPNQFFEEVDFLSIGGNDLKQFFFAADRENERVRRRYDTLNTSFLNFLEQIVERARASNTELSYCGEDAGRPIDAICFAALGIKNLSMRPASIAPVKYLIRRVDLKDVKFVIDQSRNEGHESVRTSVINWVKKNT
ncbi:phosphoenolpyruvate--protein phosphotransferase, partial [Planktomarina sp.]|nr:phosphoenolpyruvate--protein phosphotransferase [Planktomarina sp.]